VSEHLKKKDHAIRIFCMLHVAFLFESVIQKRTWQFVLVMDIAFTSPLIYALNFPIDSGIQVNDSLLPHMNRLSVFLHELLG
jgi:hypothetical protein